MKSKSKENSSKAGNDKIITLVTGANKGVGYETVRRLIKEGHCVYLAARNPKLGKAAAQETGANFIELDVTSDDSVKLAVEYITINEARLDILINNAGVSGPIREAQDYTPDDAMPVVLTNLVGYVRMMHAFIPLLKKSGNPQIINVSSGLGSFGLFHDKKRIESRFGSPLYAASKAAINMLTARYASLLPDIRINAVDPGMTATDLSGGNGHSLKEGTDAIIRLAIHAPDSPTGTFQDLDGEIPW